jgi:hypothetical protein
VTLSTSWFTRKGWLYCVLYVLFENAMGTVKLWAVITGERAELTSAGRGGKKGQERGRRGLPAQGGSSQLKLLQAQLHG